MTGLELPGKGPRLSSQIRAADASSRTAESNSGGNGGLSLRKLSKVREVLSFQNRVDNTESEDVWFDARLPNLPKSKNANASVSTHFSVEDVWSDRPLGYHINPTLTPLSSPDVWADYDKRKEIFSYCPEIQMLLPMKLERERCPP
jgi:hypothetical protein